MRRPRPAHFPENRTIGARGRPRPSRVRLRRSSGARSGASGACCSSPAPACPYSCRGRWSSHSTSSRCRSRSMQPTSRRSRWAQRVGCWGRGPRSSCARVPRSRSPWIRCAIRSDSRSNSPARSSRSSRRRVGASASSFAAARAASPVCTRRPPFPSCSGRRHCPGWRNLPPNAYGSGRSATRSWWSAR